MDDNYNAFDASGEWLYFDVELNGTTWVDALTTGMRIWAGKVLTSGSGNINAGDITVRWKATTANIFAIIPTGIGQTQISNFTIPANWEGDLLGGRSSMQDASADRAEMYIKVRDFGSDTFRLTENFLITNTVADDDEPLLEYTEKTDICFRCGAITNANGIIVARYILQLVKNQ